MNTDDICPEVRHNIKLTQRCINAEVQGSAKAADYPIQDEIAKSKIEFFNHQKTRISFNCLSAVEVLRKPCNQISNAETHAVHIQNHTRTLVHVGV